MARKKIRECRSKALVKEHLKRLANLELDHVAVQITPQTQFTASLLEENPWLKTERLVVKPDMLFGKRGKSGLVLLDATFEQAKEHIKKFQGTEVTMNGVTGILTHFLIERFVPHKDEYYLSIQSKLEGNVIGFSTAGGVEIEENWDKLIEVMIPIDVHIEQADIDSLVVNVPVNQRENLLYFIRAMYKVFDDLCFTLLEMNPFTLTNKGFLPLDMRGELDDTALFLCRRKWRGVEFPRPFGSIISQEEDFIASLDEKTGASLKLTVLNPSGHIWLMVAGGGASVIYTDTVVDLGYGHELGNYGEYSGGPSEEETFHYAKTILDLVTAKDDGKPKALIVGGGIANFTDIAETFKGIIGAIEEYREVIEEQKIKIFVRRGGPNYKIGLNLMKTLGSRLNIPIEVYGPETSMTAIVPMAINYVAPQLEKKQP